MMGIVALFTLIVTFFAACLCLDERRRRDRRDACIVCYRHSDAYQPNKCSRSSSLLQLFFLRVYSPFLTKPVVKVCSGDLSSIVLIRCSSTSIDLKLALDFVGEWVTSGHLFSVYFMCDTDLCVFIMGKVLDIINVDICLASVDRIFSILRQLCSAVCCMF